MDPVRKTIIEAVAARRMTLADLSKKVGKNHAYFQQFVKRGVPSRLPEEIRIKAAAILGVDEARLGGPERDGPRRVPIGEEFAPDGEFEIVPAVTADGDRRALPENAVPEIDVIAGAGGGGYALPAEIHDGSFSYAADAVRAAWIMPEEFLEQELQVSVRGVQIIRVRGNSMEPDLRPGDRVMVDRRDKAVRQGGVFAVRDGDEIIVKNVELIRNTDPPRIICKSINPNVAPFELVLDGSAEIIGRVVLKMQRM